MEEFSRSICYANDFYSNDSESTNCALPYVDDASNGPKERTDKTIAWTNFEKKYDDVGEKTYELLLRQKLWNLFKFILLILVIISMKTNHTNLKLVFKFVSYYEEKFTLFKQCSLASNLKKKKIPLKKDYEQRVTD